MIMGVCVGASPAVARPGAEIQPERTGANVVPEPAPSSGAVDSHKPLFRPLAPNADAARALALRDPKAASTGGGAIRTVLSLGLVLGLIALAGAVFKRFLAPRLGLAASLGGAGRSPAGLLEILGRYPVGSGGALVLLKLDRRILLLSQQRAGRVGLRSGGGGFTPLCEITEPEELASILAKAREASGESISSKFRSLLGKFEQTAREHDPEPSARGCTPAVLSDVVQFSRDAVAGPTGEAPAARAPLPDATESLRLRLATMRIRGAKA
jgi:flagellar biogenesis protein FliO